MENTLFSLNSFKVMIKQIEDFKSKYLRMAATTASLTSKYSLKKSD